MQEFFLIDIKLEWGGFGEELMGRTKPQLRQAPVTFFSKFRLPILYQQCFLIIRQIPSVFSGHHLVVYGLLKDEANIPKDATLIVHTPDKKVLSIKVPLDPMTTDGSLIHR